MKLPLFWIDAFADRVFRGNPAAVVLSEQPLDAELMQRIAMENNLAETAFVVPKAPGFAIQWFTPTSEVDLCGHATLASAYVLFEIEGSVKDLVEFSSRSGALRVKREAARLALDFPARPARRAPELQEQVCEALAAPSAEAWAAQATMALLESEEEVRALVPRMDLVARLPGYGLVVTAPGYESDFVSRFFAPQVGVPEDPVTGSTHCTLVPYWSRRLGKSKLYARQLSARGGELWCEDRQDRTIIAGHCALYMRGEISV